MSLPPKLSLSTRQNPLFCLRQWIARFLACGLTFLGFFSAVRAASVDVTPRTIGGDGAFTQVTVAEQPVWQNSGTGAFIYFKRPTAFAFTAGQTLYLRVTYHDDLGGGKLSMQYDAQTASYSAPEISTRVSRVGTGQFVDAFFELKNVFFGGRQNGTSDFRIACGAPGGVKMSLQKITLSDTAFDHADFQLAISRTSKSRYTGPAKDYVDTATLKGKVMAGYQGWFDAPNDLDDDGWRHWVRGNTMTAANFTTDAWPDLREYDPASLFRAGNVMTKGGAPAYLFSSTSYSVVQKHFRWMRKHNIDGAFVQRFFPKAGTQPEWVLRNVSQAAAEEGRIWAVEYDVSGMGATAVAAALQADWQWLTSTTGFDLLNDPRYARENGKPVVFIWGLPFPEKASGGVPFDVTNANATVDYFKAQGAYVIGGIPNTWSSLGTSWQSHMSKYDGLLVWQNNNTANAATIRNRGQDFYPHAWPGFSWANLKQQQANPPIEYTDRTAGEFYWDKGRDWINAGAADRLFIGMFDEYDEATQIMPMSDDPPNPSAEYGRFVDNQGKPSDWWMVLTEELKRLMLKQRSDSATQPTVASLANRSNIGPEASADLGTTDLNSSLNRVQQTDGDTVVETVGGKDCRGNLDPATDRYLYFNVANNFAFQLTNGDVTIEVEYFDNNLSTVLGLQYDSTSSVPTNPAFTTHPQNITTTGSNTWRTVRFEIADAYFGGRQNGSSDFRLNFNGKKLNVNRVWVRLPEPKAYPFTWTNAATGSALTWSQNANWLGGIVAQSDGTSRVRLFPGQTMPGGVIPITNNLSGQQFAHLTLGGAASASSNTTVTLGGNSLSLTGVAPAIALEATNTAFTLTYDLATPLSLLGPTQLGGEGDATFRISGVISGSGGITKTGSAKATLSGANTYSGNTTVGQGTLALGFANAGNNASTVTIAATGATLDLTYTGTDIVDKLFIGTTPMPPGVYGNNSSAFPVIGIPKITGNGTLTVNNGPAPDYNSWAFSQAPTGTLQDDFDSDGVSNGVEYVLGGNKNTSDLGKFPNVSTTTANFVFTFKRAQASLDGTTILRIEVGTTLTSWPLSYTVPSGAVTNNPGLSVIKNSSPGFDTVTLTLPLPSQSVNFARLRVTN